MVFFKIGATDVTPWIDIQNYEMDREDVYSSWTDGNWVDHRVIARTRISGEFQAGFEKATDFAAFMSLLQTAKTADGYYAVTAYCGNTGTTEVFNAYLDTESEAKWDLVNSRQWQVVTVKVRFSAPQAVRLSIMPMARISAKIFFMLDSLLFFFWVFAD